MKVNIKTIADLFTIFLSSYLLFYLIYGMFINPNILRPIVIECGPQASMLEECYQKRWNPVEYGKCLEKTLKINETYLLLNSTTQEIPEKLVLYHPKTTP